MLELHQDGSQGWGRGYSRGRVLLVVAAVPALAVVVARGAMVSMAVSTVVQGCAPAGVSCARPIPSVARRMAVSVTIIVMWMACGWPAIITASSSAGSAAAAFLTAA